jgi:hypothetical protein
MPAAQQPCLTYSLLWSVLLSAAMQQQGKMRRYAGSTNCHHLE